jgi:hypothetical protein
MLAIEHLVRRKAIPRQSSSAKYPCGNLPGRLCALIDGEAVFLLTHTYSALQDYKDKTRNTLPDHPIAKQLETWEFNHLYYHHSSRTSTELS